MADIRIANENFDETENLARFLSLGDPNVFRYEYLTYMPEKYVFITARNENNHFVGSQALMPYLLNIDGREILTGRSERTLVSKELRGLNIFANLYDECINSGRKNEMQFVWGTTSAIKAFQKVGFLFHHNYWEHAICCLKLSNFISLLANKTVSTKFKLAQLLTAPFSIVTRLVIPFFCRKPSDITILDDIKDPKDFKSIYDELRQQGPLVHLVQDPQFLLWAYNLDQRRTYLRLYAYTDDILSAYIHLDLSHTAIARLVDFAESKPGTIGYLLQEARRRLKKSTHSTMQVSFNFKNPQLKKTSMSLYANGFFPISREGHMCIRPIDFIDMNILGDIHPWYITEIWNTLSK